MRKRRRHRNAGGLTPRQVARIRAAYGDVAALVYVLEESGYQATSRYGRLTSTRLLVLPPAPSRRNPKPLEVW